MDISFVVIGYNEASFIGNCLASIRNANLKGIEYELIYVDGGSQDNSYLIAESMNVDKLLGGEKRRRAAGNRNLGMMAAKGRFVQFVDGDMTLNASWPVTAMDFLIKHPNVAAVCGHLKEINPSILYQTLQIDWTQKKGPVDFCGGAAMWRRSVLKTINGFPESVQYGEEPFLCWRVRNELDYEIYFLNQTMADHNLDYAGFGDYWQRNIRCGQTYAEIAYLCYNTPDRLWFKMTVSNLAWSAGLISALVIFLAGPQFIKAWIAILLFLILLRKILQMLNRKNKLAVSIGYAVHVYFSKIPLAFGELKWFFRMLKKRHKH